MKTCPVLKVFASPLLFAVALALAPVSHATVATVAYWRFGENDPGAANGGTNTVTTNLVGGVMTLRSNAVYTTNVSAKAGSTLGLQFATGRHGTNALVSTLINNFGLELWLRPDATNGMQCLAYNGDSGSSGWGLYLIGNQFRGLLGGVVFVGSSAPAATNVWTHLALVRDNGTNTLYVNGVVSGMLTTAPNLPAGRFVVAAQPQSLTAEFFTGALDEVRVFSFAPGGFSTNDLLLHFNQQPPVATTGAATQTTATNATLNGTVNPGNLATAAWFEWGTTTNYGSFTATNTLAVTNVPLAVSSPLTGLTLNTTYHYRAAASNALGLSYGADMSFTPSDFTLVNVPGLTFQMYGCPTCGDYDNDGKLDFFNPAGNLAQVQPLWRNTGNTFTNSGIVLTRSIQGTGDTAAWADYDNDGRVDFIEVGVPTLVLWRNTGSGFTNVTTAMGINGTSPSISAAWGDYDNDGRPDFIVTGIGQPQIWRNTTNGFVNLTATLAPGLPMLTAVPHAAWADFDNDGRLDFILTGRASSSIPITQLWRNTGSGFTDVMATVAPTLPGTAAAATQGSEHMVTAAWGDYDNDGWLDLLITGATNAASTAFMTQLWHNNGGTFTNVPIAGLPQFGVGASVAWGDYDNDGRLDFIIMGTERRFTTNVTQLWRNAGSTFTNVAIAGLPPVWGGGTAGGDFDNDGRLDFLLSGIGSNNVAQVWRNLSPVANTPPTAPTGLSVVPTTNGVLLSWNAASDAQTPSSGLSYNVRAGTTPGGNDLISGNVAAGTGFRRIPEPGNAQMNRFRRFSLPNLPLGRKVYWSVQAIDTAFAGGPFATESVFTNGFALVSVPGLNAGESAAWGDYDHDGLLDVFIAGHGTAKLWRNTGSTFTNVPIAGLSGLFSVAVAWGDFDNDGRLDFIITGSTTGDELGALVQLWRNTGSGFTNVAASRLAGLPGLYVGAVAWGDYDNDGRLDLALCGIYDDGNGGAVRSQLWHNTGSNFVNVTGSVVPGLAAIFSGALAWADYDGDGRLDLVLVGGGASQLWHNTGSNFVNVTASVAPGLPPLVFASAAWSDYDNDGRPDLFVTGQTNAAPLQNVSQLWRNTGSGFTNVAIVGLPGVFGGRVQWGDYDADGWLDFILSGTLSDGVSPTKQLWHNTATGFAQVPFLLPNQGGSTTWVDYDNDGRLDFLNTGGSGVQLWHNQLGTTNTPPTAPAGLAMTRTVNAALLSWNAATDAQTPSSGLSYNVRAGTTPGGTDLLAAHVNAANGFRRVPARGNADQRQFLPLVGVTNGQTVYWSVQAVDTSFAGGPFATETSVITIPTLHLSLNSQSSTLNLSWTPPTFGWVLQQSTNLNSPSNWVASPAGSLNPVTVDATNTAKFYRVTWP